MCSRAHWNVAAWLQHTLSINHAVNRPLVVSAIFCMKVQHSTVVLNCFWEMVRCLKIKSSLLCPAPYLHEAESSFTSVDYFPVCKIVIMNASTFHIVHMFWCIENHGKSWSLNKWYQKPIIFNISALDQASTNYLLKAVWSGHVHY